MKAERMNAEWRQSKGAEEGAEARRSADRRAEPRNRPRKLERSTCFACSPENRRGLHLDFETANDGAMTAVWRPDDDLAGFRGITHGGVVSTVLDEAMAKVVAAAGVEALTAELRVRFRRQVTTGVSVRIRGWIEKRDRRIFYTEAALTGPDGNELAHAWASFLVLK